MIKLLSVPPTPEVLLWTVDGPESGLTIRRWVQANLTVRLVRGGKMKTLASLFDEFAAALQFPWYFGENRDAFDECITDLGWLEVGRGIVIVISQPLEVLTAADADLLGWLISALSLAQAEWSKPVSLGESWDRPPTPFHVVLLCPPAEAARVVRRWSAAGANICRLAA